MLTVAATGNDVFKCTDPAGSVTFTDQGCDPAEQVEQPAIDVTVVAPAELTPAERKLLTDVEHRQRARRLEYARSQRQSAANRRRAQAGLQKRCAQAAAELEEIRATRRHGYPLSQDKALGERERSLENLRAENCP